MLRTLFVSLVLAGSVTAGAAEPILVPEFSPGTPNEFTVAIMLGSQVKDRLLADGHIVLDDSVVGPIVGAEATRNCIDLPSCPTEVLKRLPSRIAVVVRVTRQGPALMAHLELWEQSSVNAVVVRDMAIPAGNEAVLAQEVSMETAALIRKIGPSSDAVLMAAARLIAGQGPAAGPPPAPIVRPAPIAPVPAPLPVPVPVPVPWPAPAVVVPSPVPSPASSPNGALGPETGVFQRHVVGSEQHFKNSGMDPRDWVYKNMPHAGRVAFEIRAGLGMGDNDRSADIRVELVDGNDQRDDFYQEGPQSSRRPQGGIYLGYAPATMIDIGIVGGLQWGERSFTTGWTRVSDTNPGSAVSKRRSGDQVMVYIQPRLRGYLVPVGPAKPYLFTGADIRFFDDYDLAQPVNFKYPVPAGGTIPGWIGGGGLMLDPSPIAGFFFEGSYSQFFGPRAEAFMYGNWVHDEIDVPVGVGYNIALTGGIQIRI